MITNRPFRGFSASDPWTQLTRNKQRDAVRDARRDASHDASKDAKVIRLYSQLLQQIMKTASANQKSNQISDGSSNVNFSPAKGDTPKGTGGYSSAKVPEGIAGKEMSGKPDPLPFKVAYVPSESNSSASLKDAEIQALKDLVSSLQNENYTLSSAVIIGGGGDSGGSDGGGSRSEVDASLYH